MELPKLLEQDFGLEKSFSQVLILEHQDFLALVSHTNFSRDISISSAKQFRVA